MGTHPIFESDFDCLTDCLNRMNPISRLALRSVVRQVRPLSVSVQLNHGGVTMSAEQVQAAWVEYFDSEDCDFWYLRRGFAELLKDDFVPTPEIVQAALYCARRNNNLPAAIRIIEYTKLKCGDRPDLYEFLLQELQPTFDDLGMKLPEELGLDIVVTEYDG